MTSAATTVSARPPERIALLLVEDSEADSELILHALRRDGLQVRYERVWTETAFEAALGRDWDVIISDYHLPGFDGMDVFARCQARCPDTPFIFVSGAMVEQVAVDAMLAGASDYVLKSKLGRLTAAVRRELQASRARRERRVARQAVARERERLAVALRASEAGVVEYSVPDGWVLDARASELLGVPTSGLLGLRDLLVAVADRFAGHTAAATLTQAEALMAGRIDRAEFQFRLRDAVGRGYRDLFAVATIPQQAPDGAPERIVGAIYDVTQRKALSDQLRHAQKMDAMGRLAGGVAHDFNNVLTAILGFGDLLVEAMPPDAIGRREVGEIIKAAEHASHLTQRLLAFSRPTQGNPRHVDLNAMVHGIRDLLSRLLDSTMTLQLHCTGDVIPMLVDPGGLEQVMMNLVVNARDATACGGRVVVETYVANVATTPPADAPLLSPGRYGVLAVHDQGIGIAEEDLQRIFEPFYTTKAAGKGTGLGLSTCHAIVAAAGGCIGVTSRLGAGTTFRVYVPLSEAAPSLFPTEQASARLLNVRAELLVVEPDVRVRSMLAATLAGHGHRVDVLCSADAAVSRPDELGGPYDLAVLAWSAPGARDTRVLEALVGHLRQPCLLFTTGADELPVVDLPGARIATLRKPYAPASLDQAILDLLSQD